MKKAYSKPELYYERYELSSNIAGNCATGLPVGEIGPYDYETCTVGIGGGNKLFLNVGIGCNTEPIEGNGYCYQSFALNEMLFSS
ncbi:MAG: hypothetical protein ACI3VK_01805 [Oscillospiraceae bacterium]